MLRKILEWWRDVSSRDCRFCGRGHYVPRPGPEASDQEQAIYRLRICPDCADWVKKLCQPATYADPPARRGTTWIEPEISAEMEEADRRHNRDQFFVYVMQTGKGYYVGHTYHVGLRVAQHKKGAVCGTRLTDPELAWVSNPEPTRRAAASLEAALKHHLQYNPARFAMITGLSIGRSANAA